MQPGTLVLLLSLGLAVYLDVTTPRWIPNWLTLPLALAGLAGGFVTGGWPGLGDHTAAMVALLIPFLFLWTRRIVGGGDAKLCMAIGAWIGTGALGVFLTAWGIFNLLGGLWGTFKGSGYSLSRWWQEQSSSLRALRLGVLTNQGAHGYRGAVTIALATIATLYLR